MRQPSSVPSTSPSPPPSQTPRRAFVARLAGMMAAWPLLGRRLGGVPTPRPAPNASHLASVLEALGDAVLPAELGAAGSTRAVNEFQQWMDGYRAGAEAIHGYGTGRIDRVPPDPRPKWRTQLAALDAE